MVVPYGDESGWRDLGRLQICERGFYYSKIAKLTNGIAIDIEMLRAPERSDGSLFEQLGIFRFDGWVSKSFGVDTL